ncbi:MAG: MBOAT family protein [Lachnospiraceae bacterium]|nr:MBOAT family protein [Lachnospiraceae bacterium]
MLINSVEFLVFFPIVLLFLLIMPKSWRIIWMLAAGYFFFMSWSPANVGFLVFTTLTTYFAARYLEKKQSKPIVAVTVIVNIIIILLGKYFNLIPVPVGVSFYTLQALGYVIDIYRKKTAPEKNLLKYALFVSFFPIIQSGPIERSTGLLKQIQKYDEIQLGDLERIRGGLLLIVWGLFQKMVIADRAAILVNKVYGDYSAYGAFEIIIASLMFSVEIYCDFGGYSNIAIGIARIMGFDVMQNFRQPYLATSIKDFWRRWHISLTSWLTDYVYISLGGNRKGQAKKYIFIIIVFAVSGIWHGRAFSFIVWGLLHAIYQIVGDLKTKIFKRTADLKPTGIVKIVKIVVTFMLVNFAWMFFAASGLNAAIDTIKQIFKVTRTSSIFELGLEKGDWIVLILAFVIVLIVDILHEKNISIKALLDKNIFVLRWIVYAAALLVIIIFGIYGVEYDTATFMYAQF